LLIKFNVGGLVASRRL